MIQHIVLHCGSHRYTSEVQHFVLNNQALFEQQGIFYPKIVYSGKDQPHGHELFLRIPENAQNQQLNTIRQTADRLQQPANTLLLSVDQALYEPEKLHQFVECVRRVFPEASIHCAIDFAPQHTELYSIFCAANLIFQKNITTSQELLERYASVLLYDLLLSRLQHVFGPENLHVAIPASTEEQALPHVRNNLLKALQLAGKTEFAASLSQERCYLDFMAPLPLVHMQLQAPPTWLWAIWFSRHQALSALAQSHPDFYTLFSQQEQQNIVAYYQDSNSRTAALIGVPQLFPDTGEIPYTQPYSGLNDAQADMMLEYASERVKGVLFTHTNALFGQHPNPVFSAYIHKQCKKHFLPIKSQRQSRAKLAVITHCYNQADYIAQTIESVLAQETDFAIEHLISDDASNDGTQDIIMDYARKYPHIVPLFKQARGWMPNTYNLFKNACTPYVSLCDGDDYFIDPHKLQIQVDFLEANKDCALCFHPVEVRYENNAAPTRLYPPLDLLPRGVRERYYVSDLIKTNLIQTNSVVYRWRFQEGLPEWFDPTLTMGDWYWHLLHAELGPIGFINRVMAVYRRHDKSLYYTSEVSMREHRLKHGMEELRTYETVNRHFGNKYEKSIFSLANGAFAQYLSYALDTGDNGPLEKAAKMFPHFAAVFKASLKLTKVQR